MTYTEIYKAAYNFHRQSQKILAQRGASSEAWEVIANGMIAISNQYRNDYLDELLRLVYAEMARTHKRIRED